MKKTILHIIYNLGRGGAETMLVGLLPQLPEYRHIVVTLSPINYFEEERFCDELICLQEPSLLSLPKAVLKLRKIIRQFNPALVHSHLPQSNFVARLATPKRIPLLTTIHTAISAAVDYKKWYIRFLDRFTFYRRPSTIIAVSSQALKDYFSVLNIKNETGIIIYTYVDINKFNFSVQRELSAQYNLVSIGSLRKNKNYDYLIEAFKFLKNEPVSLHIYGQGPAQEALQMAIDEAGVNIVLKGQVKNIPSILFSYDLFVMPSKFEGFSLSVLEAMAAKLPLLLSDIDSFREQCADCAIYFDIAHPADFSKQLLALIKDPSYMNMMANKGYNRMIHNFTLSHHVSKIRELYKASLVEVS